MRYLGSKARIKKDLLAVMRPEMRGENVPYVEPFVGGANVFDSVEGWKIGNDSNPYLIALYEAAQKGWKPPQNVSREEFYKIKKNPEKHPPELVGFVGIYCTFGSVWLSAYAFDRYGTNYAARGYRSFKKQMPLLKDAIFTCGDYSLLKIPKNSFIYADPPYSSCKVSYFEKTFDSEKLYNWLRAKKEKGATVFLSEYSAPPDFKCVFEKEIEVKANGAKRLKKTEKLFTL